MTNECAIHADRVYPRDCASCGHSSDDHRLDDALNIGPCDPAARFRCILCRCPSFDTGDGCNCVEEERQ